MGLSLTCAIIFFISPDALCAAAEPTPPESLVSFFQPPEEYRNDLGIYKSPLLTAHSTSIDSAAGWNQRREELRREWHKRLGPWPPLIAAPGSVVESTSEKDGLTQSKVRIAAGIDGEPVYGYLLKPPGDGPFPAVLVLYYEPETGAGFGKELRDFGLQLARRGFVTLSIGPPRVGFLPSGAKPSRAKPYYGPIGKPVKTQPISALAYAAANCHAYLAQQSFVDGARIGVMGHSFGGKWAMFASCLFDKFASAVWSDPGVVFDERDRKDNVGGSVNYWDKWYLGFELGEIAPQEDRFHFRGLPTERDRTGAYRQLRAEGRDLVELHSLMAPRPFLVSGGSADRKERWSALNHSIAVNRLLGEQYGVAMTNRDHHAPTSDSNDQLYRFFEWSLRRR
jgi:dienelactone hydrolase